VARIEILGSERGLISSAGLHTGGTSSSRDVTGEAVDVTGEAVDVTTEAVDATSEAVNATCGAVDRTQMAVETAASSLPISFAGIRSQLMALKAVKDEQRRLELKGDHSNDTLRDVGVERRRLELGVAAARLQLAALLGQSGDPPTTS
jgi:hypothetical protein